MTGIYFYNRANEDIHSIKTGQDSINRTSKESTSSLQKVEKTTKMKSFKNKNVANLKVTKTKQDLNKIEKIKNIYFTNGSKDLDIKITKVKETVIKLHGRNKKVDHIVVKTKKKTGPTSSFEALVDPNSNTVYKTWNQTRFETNKTYKIKAAGLEFYSK